MDKMQHSNGRDPREVVTQQTYDRVAAKYAHTRNGKGSWKAELDAFWKLLSATNNRKKRILDLGCGTGRVLQHALQTDEAMSEYVGVDFSGPMLEQALRWAVQARVPFWSGREADLRFLDRPLRKLRHVLRPPRLQVHLVEQRMQDIDPPTSYFDAVILLASYHHLLTREEQETVLELVFHTLRPGGLLLITAWNLSGDEGVVDIPFTDEQKKTPRYYWRFSRESLMERLLYAGFELVEDLTPPKAESYVLVLTKPALSQVSVVDQ